MVILSQALQGSSDIVLKEFGWRHGASTIEKGGDINSGASGVSKAAAGAAAPSRSQSAYITGEIRPFRGDYRAAIASINALADRLRQHPAVAEVRATRMPLNVSPTAVLSGNTLESRGEQSTADFELVMLLRPKT
jgi:hypothetical protein